MVKILSKIKQAKFARLNKLKLFSLVGVCLFFIGFVGIAPTLYFRWSDTGTASASSINPNQIWGQIRSLKQSASNEKLVTGFPVYISIQNIRPALNMNVPVIPGYYNKATGAWTLSDTSAMFAPITSQPNNISGNTFIYGHFRPNVFAYLHLIKPGYLATVTTNNGYKFTYKFIGSYAVVPTDPNPLGFSASPILTIQTCSGDFFQNRQMYIFSFDGYSKP